MRSRHQAVLIVAILAFGTVAALMAVAPAAGSTGNPVLGVTDSDTSQPTSFTPATSYVNVSAGGDGATTDGSTIGYFSINFGTFGGAQGVTFSGSQFSLYLSNDGLSQLSSGDVNYGGPTLFSVADLTTNAGWHSVSETLGTYHVGQTTGGQEIVTGPIPLKVSNSYKYIKIFDGMSSAVAVSAQVVNIQPGVALSPASGPAGTSAILTGGGFAPSTLIDLGYSYIYHGWGGATTIKTGNWTTSLSTGTGTFVYSAPMLDAKQAYNPTGGVQASTSISIIAKHHASPRTLQASTSFVETSRIILGALSYNAGGTLLNGNNPPPGPYGNDTGPGGTNLLQPVDVNVLGTINVAGNYWQANSAVSFYIGALSVGTSSTNGSGYFNSTIPIPLIPGGGAVFKVADGGLAYQFGITTQPSLVLAPASGSVGTHVTVQAYGFPANKGWFVYWHELTSGDHTWYQVAHGTTGSSGAFNVSVSFNVPQAYGGGHSVAVTNANVSTSSPSAPGTIEALTNLVVGASTMSTTTTTVTVTSTSTVTQQTTSTVSTTSTMTTTQATTQTETKTSLSTQTTTETSTVASGLSSSDYALVGGIVVVVTAFAAAAAWLLRGRRT